MDPKQAMLSIWESADENGDNAKIMFNIVTFGGHWPVAYATVNEKGTLDVFEYVKDTNIGTVTSLKQAANTVLAMMPDLPYDEIRFVTIECRVTEEFFSDTRARAGGMFTGIDLDPGIGRDFRKRRDIGDSMKMGSCMINARAYADVASLDNMPEFLDVFDLFEIACSAYDEATREDIEPEDLISKAVGAGSIDVAFRDPLLLTIERLRRMDYMGSHH